MPVEDGMEVEFSLIAFVPDSVTVWDDLSDDEQSAIMAELVVAMGKLYSLNFDKKQFQLLLKDSKFILEGPHSIESTSAASISPCFAMGKADIGYAKDTADLLRLLIKSLNENSEVPWASIQPSDNGISVISANGFGQVDLSNEELAAISDDTVFSNPVIYSFDAQRRLTVAVPTKLPQSLIGKCIFPRGYEYAMKDTFLGA
jgi:hypothetical protein